MAFSFISCSVCKSYFLKDNRHINENIKLGNNFYCSRKCFSIVKNKQRILVCGNPSCDKQFLRSPKDINFRNFCSVACAMEIIGPENGLKHKKYRYCHYCGKLIKSNKGYCSMKCWGKVHEISKEELINRITQLSFQLGRPPTRRECKHASSCIKYFGSWNKSLKAAGLKPYRSLNQKMYRRLICKAKDGHICDSISEKIIDDWLFMKKINHIKNQAYPSSKHRADWAISDYVFIEYFGLANDSLIYDREIQRKRSICKLFGIRLIELYSKDIYPKVKLDAFFGYF